MNVPRRLGILLSGRGTNFQAIVDAIADGKLDAVIAVVISNRPGAEGILRAREAGIETLVIDHTDRGRFPTRELYDEEILRQLKARNVGLVCLAGFMRVLSAKFISEYPNSILNIHPSLLPAFPGINAQYQAWEHGVKKTGVTVHLVNAELDGGPIVLQEVVPVLDKDDAETLSARILEREHVIYPEAIRILLQGDWRVEGRRFIRS